MDTRIIEFQRRGYRLNNSPARWQKALQRAIDEGVTVHQLATTGIWVATSGTDADTAYVVTEGDCCCKHRAMLRYRLGSLSLDTEPTPAAPVVTVPRRAAVVEVLAADGRLAYRSDDLAASRAA